MLVRKLTLFLSSFAFVRFEKLRENENRAIEKKENYDFLGAGVRCF